MLCILRIRILHHIYTHENNNDVNAEYHSEGENEGIQYIFAKDAKDAKKLGHAQSSGAHHANQD